MVNVMSLLEAASNGRRYAYDDTDTYEFIGNIEESTAEFNYNLMTEAVDMTLTLNTLDEIMVEAAVNGGRDRVRMISEGVFANFAEKVKKFFKKIIELVKGIIAKLKEFFYTLTRNTSKWMSHMESKVKEAANRSGANTLTHEMYKWNIQFVTKEMCSGITTILQKTEVSELIKTAEAKSNSYIRGSSDYEETSKEELRAITRDHDKLKAKNHEFVGKAFGLKGSNMDAIWNGIAKKAKGGSEKVTVKFMTESGLGVSNMLDAINNSTDVINDLTTAYNEHLSDLEDMNKEVTDKIEELVDKANGDNNEQKTRDQDMIRTTFGAIQDSLTFMEGVCNTARGHNVEYAKAMASDFMHALNKLAAYKEPKK